MFVLLLSLAVLSVHGQSTDHQDEALRKQVEALTEIMEMLEAENVALKSAVQEIDQSKLIDPVICFSAVKTTTQSVSSGDNILFEEELIDTHDTYNPTYGVYAIPEDGIYEVIVTLYKYRSSSYNSAYGDLYLGSTFLTRIYNRFASDTTAAAHSTSSIIREFEAGDALHVEAAGSTSFYGSTTYRASQFSVKYIGKPLSA